MSESVLDVRQVVKKFGGFRALDGVSLSIRPGEILALVGPNGSGKTTCINVVSGLYPADEGEVLFQGQRINGLSMSSLARLGINRTFQIPKPFKALTVEENVDVALRNIHPATPLVDDPLAFVGMDHVRDRMASTLNSGQQKLLDLARALAGAPKLLLVDELAAGMNPAELRQLAGKLRELASRGVALLVVEHLMGFVNQLAERVIVMNAGREIFEGSLAAAAKDATVVEVYLGG